MSNFKSSLEKFSSALSRIISHNIPLDFKSSDILNFSQKKQAYQISLYRTSYRELLNSAEKLKEIIADQVLVAQINTSISSLQENYENSNLKELPQIIEHLFNLESQVEYPRQAQSLSFRIKNLPPEISSEMNADLNELERCFHSGCYRASVILCGRLLETALHRKYFEATKIDILEKNPGIGLGTLVAKLRDKDILLDPAITQQIHLINQVRIYSVHIKKESFSPNKEQTHAIILYTLDIIRKLLS